MGKIYKITKQQCQSMIDKQMPIVCSYCGGKIEPIETVDNAGDPTYWSGCLGCERFEGGTSPEIYDIAVKLVDKNHFSTCDFSDMPEKEKQPEEYAQWHKSQIHSSVQIITEVLRVYGGTPRGQQGWGGWHFIAREYPDNQYKHYTVLDKYGNIESGVLFRSSDDGSESYHFFNGKKIKSEDIIAYRNDFVGVEVTGSVTDINCANYSKAHAPPVPDWFDIEHKYEPKKYVYLKGYPFETSAWKGWNKHHQEARFFAWVEYYSTRLTKKQSG